VEDHKIRGVSHKRSETRLINKKKKNYCVREVINLERKNKQGITWKEQSKENST